ncbi:MAG: protein translocase subunit SecDF [Dysgonamonadaceae bacterium]|jgi:SecD/SecF fusion protein|nr:protein translocase subunit SecDF [Dysgonamonadaceae bacterium]
MQNKGFIKVFAVSLTLVCLFYLSFTVVTNKYYKQAKLYAGDNTLKESQFLDSLATEKVWLGYTLKKCRSMELNLGLDLKGGMNVIMEISVPDVLKTLANNSKDPIFNQALDNARQKQVTSQRDFISLFAEEYHKLDQGARLSVLFGTMLRDKITVQSTDDEVISVLRSELKSAIDNSFNVLRTRIDRFGVVAPNIQQMDIAGRISIELPGIKEPARVRNLLQGSANLEFWETYNLSEIYQPLLSANTIIKELNASEKTTADSVATDLPETHLPAQTTEVAKETEQVTSATADADTSKTDQLLAEIGGVQQDTTSTTTQAQEQEQFEKEYPLFTVLQINQYNGQVGSGPVVGTAHYRDTAKVNAYLNLRPVKDILPRNVIFRWTVKAIDVKEQFYQLVALKVTTRDGKAPLEGDVVVDARDDFSQYSSSAEVSMTMNNEGAKKWARLTKENLNRSIAIVLDNNVYSFPNVNSEITGGRSSITGNFTAEEAKDLANVLKSGKMSAPARIVSEDVVGPSLGQEAINKGFISFAVALAVLMLYLIFVYGWKPGMIANIALLLNLFFTLGVLASFQAVLTLPGIAGIVLALAVAVDANVLIYERIKEELRGGKMIKKAVEEGYKRAFSAIFDSNLTSVITGFILFYFGTGPIRGFATTLIIGIFVSFFTAVFLTRLTYETAMAKGKLLDLTFVTQWTKNFLVNPSINFFKQIKLVYIVTVGITVICLAFLLFRGLNQGIDFTGGRNYVIRFHQPVNTVSMQEMLDPFFPEHVPSVITIGTPNQVRVTTNYKITDNSEGVDEEITQKMYEALNPLLTDDVSYDQFVQDYILSSQKVGPSIADDIKQGAILAVIFAVISIGLYILLRFRDLSYSVATIVSLALDALIILGAYAMFWGILPFSLEVDQTFIAAILTAIGYSINDKVVIFDRVREYTTLYPKRDKNSLFNEALNSTLNRTFNTSFSTFLVLIVIFIFAGDAIRSFSFAMIIGVVMGTLSSLFVAAPIAYEIQNKAQLKLQAKEQKKS